MNTKIVWRLKEQPTTESLRELVKDKILTTDEARKILFSQETEESRDVESYKSEIKFLRELVDKISSRKDIVPIVKQIEYIYIKQPWYQPYYTWYTTSGYSNATGGNYTLTGTATTTGSNFSDIQTF